MQHEVHPRRALESLHCGSFCGCRLADDAREETLRPGDGGRAERTEVPEAREEADGAIDGLRPLRGVTC